VTGRGKRAIEDQTDELAQIKAISELMPSRLSCMGKMQGAAVTRVGPSVLPSFVRGGSRRRSLAPTLGALGFRVQPTRRLDGARPGHRRRAIFTSTRVAVSTFMDPPHFLLIFCSLLGA